MHTQARRQDFQEGGSVLALPKEVNRSADQSVLSAENFFHSFSVQALPKVVNVQRREVSISPHEVR